MIEKIRLKNQFDLSDVFSRVTTHRVVDSSDLYEVYTRVSFIRAINPFDFFLSAHRTHNFNMICANYFTAIRGFQRNRPDGGITHVFVDLLL